MASHHCPLAHINPWDRSSMTRSVFIVSCLVFWLCHTASGSIINFAASPPTVIQDLSRFLTLRCSLSDTILTVNSTAAPPGDPTYTATNVRHVSSIVVTRGENQVHVATVSQYDAARALVDVDTLKVTGDVMGNGAEKGYLELLWSDPSYNQSDAYMCEVNAIDALGHVVVYSTELEFGFRPATEQELVQHLHNLEAGRDADRKKLSELQAQISTIKADLANLTLPHSEQGTVGCGSSDHWTPKPHNHLQKIVFVAFRNFYDTKPFVHVGITQMDIENHRDTKVSLSVQYVTRFGFQLVCETWSRSKVYGVGVQWLSIEA